MSVPKVGHQARGEEGCGQRQRGTSQHVCKQKREAPLVCAQNTRGCSSVALRDHEATGAAAELALSGRPGTSAVQGSHLPEGNASHRGEDRGDTHTCLPSPLGIREGRGRTGQPRANCLVTTQGTPGPPKQLGGDFVSGQGGGAETLVSMQVRKILIPLM